MGLWDRHVSPPAGTLSEGRLSSRDQPETGGREPRAATNIGAVGVVASPLDSRTSSWLTVERSVSPTSGREWQRVVGAGFGQDVRVIAPWPASTSVEVRAGGLLREWQPGDFEAMVGLFDTAEMDRRTPLASPFDAHAAARYVAAARQARRHVGALHLAITRDGGAPLGEVLAFPIGDGSSVELAYAVGAAYTGHGLARRAVTAVLELTRGAGVSHVELRITDDNLASQRVAAATGFTVTTEPYVERRRKGQVLRLATWRQSLRPLGAPDRRPEGDTGAGGPQEG